MQSVKYSKKLFQSPLWIVILIIILAVLIWPVNLIGRPVYTSASLERGLFNHVSLSDGYYFRGEFTPSYKTLKSLSFLFNTNGQAGKGYMLLEIFDENQEVVSSTKLDASHIKNNRFTEFPVSLSVTPDAVYEYQISVREYGETPLSLYLGNPGIGPEESGECYYNGSHLENIRAAVIYTYQGKMTLERALPYYTCILILGILLYTALQTPELTKEDIA